MPYSRILTRAFEVVRREPALWVLGFLFALFGGGGSTPSFNWNLNSGNFRGGDFRWEGGSAEIPAWLTPENLGAIVLVIVAITLVLMVIGLLGQSVALTGLIKGADRAATGEDVHWGQLWRSGLSREGRRVIGLRLVISLPLLTGALLSVGGLVLVGLPLMRSALAGNEPGPGLVSGMIGAMLLLIPLFLLLVVVSWVLNLIGHYAVRTIVLEGTPVMPALRRGWGLLRDNVGATIVLAILLGVIGMIAGIVIGLALLFILAVVGVPLFILLLNQGFPLLPTIVSAIALGLFAGLLGASLQGPLLAYSETAWTLAWRHLTGALPADETELTPVIA